MYSYVFIYIYMYVKNDWVGPIPSFIPPKDREENNQPNMVEM